MAQGLEITGGGRFEVRRELGAGGMGVVYEVFDRQQQAVVALKTLRQLEPRTLLRFKNEFRALADLQHENLVRLGELFADAERWYFTMELVRGQDFLSWVRDQPAGPQPVSGIDVTMDVGPDLLHAGGAAPAGSRPRAASGPIRPVREDRLRAALAQLASGLGALHAAGKVHRDVKPPNVLVTPEGRVVLLDFGLVVNSGGSGFDTDSHVVGTAAYMSPEQAASRPVGPAADWYAVGAMLYEALTGVPPFTGGPLAVLMEKQRREPPPPSRLVPSVPEDLDRACMELLRVDPAARLSGAAALLRFAGAPMPRAQTPVPSASMQGGPFVGRADELAELHAAREAAPGAITMLISGESGIGKSALARKFLAAHEQRVGGALVLAARCYEREAVPFKALDGLVDELSRHLSRLDQREAALLLPDDAATVARLFPVLRRVPAMERLPDVRVGDPQELRTRAFSALRELLARMAADRPLALFIDDFQWADDDSIALIEHLMHGSAAPPLLLLLTGRPGTVLPALTSRVHTITLAGLDRASARGLVALLGGAGSVDATALAAEAEGHPLFLQELVRHAQSGAPAGPVLLDEALLARADALEPAVRTLLEVLALAGEPLPVRIAADAARATLAEVHARLGLLRAAHLARTVGDSERAECYHDRVREAVSASLDPARHRSLHLALAAALEASGAAGSSPHTLVRHLEAAGETDRAAVQAELAAGRAAEALAFDRAAGLYRTALRLGHHAEEPRRKLLIALGDALVNAGRGAEAAAVLEQAAAGADVGTRLDCRRRAAQHLLSSGNTEEGLRAIGAVLAELGETLPATPQRALASLLWGRAALRLRGMSFRARDASDLSARELHRVDVYQAVAIGLGMVDTIRGADFQVRGLRAALAVGETTRVVRSLGLDAGYLSSQGVAARARVERLVARMRELIVGNRDPYLRAWTASADGTSTYLMGEFASCLPALLEAETIFRDETTGYAWELTTIRLFIMLSLRNSGRFVELRRRYEAHVPEAARRGDRYGEASLTRVGCIAWLAADAPEVVDAQLERCAWHPPPGGYHLQNWYEWLIRAEVALYHGEAAALLERSAQTAVALRRSLLWRVQTIRTEYMWLDAQLALVAGGPEAHARAAAHARRLRSEHVGYGLAWADLLDAAVARQRGDHDGARRLLGQGSRLAAAAGMSVTAACAELVLARLEGEPGAARRARAIAALDAAGVARPEKFAAAQIPGFTPAYSPS